MVATVVTEKWNEKFQIWEPHSMEAMNVQLTEKHIHARVSGTKIQFCRQTGESITKLIHSSDYRRFVLPDSVREE